MLLYAISSAYYNISIMKNLKIKKEQEKKEIVFSLIIIFYVQHYYYHLIFIRIYLRLLTY